MGSLSLFFYLQNDARVTDTQPGWEERRKRTEKERDGWQLNCGSTGEDLLHFAEHKSHNALDFKVPPFRFFTRLLPLSLSLADTCKCCIGKKQMFGLFLSEDEAEGWRWVGGWLGVGGWR